MKPIICVTDFNDHTLDAARTAAAFAQRWGERVMLVHSVDEREQFPLGLRERLAGTDSRRLSEEARELRGRGFDFEEKLLLGMPEDGIAGFAWRSGAGLVVVGSAPTAALEHWALGCIAEEISETCLVPVLAVRSAAAFQLWLAGGKPLKVWMAVDPAARPDAMLHRIEELRELGECEFTAAFVHYPENPLEVPAVVAHPSRGRPSELPTSARGPLADVMQEFISRDVRFADSRVREATAAELIDEAKRAGADLMIVTSHPGKDLSLLPHRSRSHGIVCHAPMNVLCVPEPDIEPAHHAAHGGTTTDLASHAHHQAPGSRVAHNEAVR